MAAQSLRAYSGASLDLRPESVWVSLQNGFHSRLPCALVLHVVAAIDAVAAVTVPSRSKALTVPADALCR